MKDTYMEIAEVISKKSKATRLKVGAIVVKDNRILSIGYNGTPAKWDNECEHEIDGQLKTKPEVIHAEANCLAKLARSTESAEDASLFITHAPCFECSKQIYTAGISNVFYKHEYRDNAGVEFLKKCNIRVSKIDEEDNSN